MKETDMKKINDEKMADINAGYYEDDCGKEGYGKEIKCPNCTESRKDMIEYRMSDDILVPGHYHCKNCRAYFDIK